MVADGEESQRGKGLSKNLPQDLEDLDQIDNTSVGGSSKEKQRVRIQARPQNITEGSTGGTGGPDEAIQEGSASMCDDGGEQASLRKKNLRDVIQARKDVYMHLTLSIYSIWVLGFRVFDDTRYYLHLGLFILSSLNLVFRLDPILTLVKKRECQKAC
jgi:hypothetical protein